MAILNRTLLAVVVALILLVVGTVFVLQLAGPKTGSPASSLPPTPYITLQPAVVPKVLQSVSGTIMAKGENLITIEASIPQVNGVGQVEGKLEGRKVIIGAATKITALEFVEEKGTNRSIPKETALSLANLKTGQRVMVYSAEDIRIKEEFLATQIRVLSYTL